ncbi:MAG: tRNA 2-thiouridine(34) synthase MnmA [Candidatus Omnitrophota bacterium]
MKLKKAIVAMSGGIDSSFCVHFLQKAGYQVSGLTMRLSNDSETITRAKKMAEVLGIKHQIVDIRDVFKKAIMDYFAYEYTQARTPNPCLRCNKFIKFGILMQIAKKAKSFFATGHYARVLRDREKNIYELRKGIDAKKDQSYVLYALKQDHLSRLLLPLGDFTKEQVYREIKKLKLPLRPGKESQDICFIPDRDYAGFIKKHIPNYVPHAGNIVTPEGEVLGRHKGIIHYTIGQRKGLGIAHNEPLFVCGFDVKKNQVVVTTNKNLGASTFLVREVSFMHRKYLRDDFIVRVKIRYHHIPQTARVKRIGSKIVQVKFKNLQRAITPGQGAVFYKNDLVLGGGVIAQVIR